MDVWDDPAHEGDNWHRQTQLILGERVLVVQQRAEWSEILAVQQPTRQHPMGYPGWVRSRRLVPGWVDASLWLVVMAPQTMIYATPDRFTAPIMLAHLDTRLQALEQMASWVSTRLPDGRPGWLASEAVRLASDPDEPYSSGSLLETAYALAGAPYLWGGTTPTGFDCSGFIYRLYHAHGITLARDAQDQGLQGQAVEPADLLPGDLLFYTSRTDGRISHVGLYWGSQQVIDAEQSPGLTRHVELEVRFAHQFVTARRIDARISSHPAATPDRKPPASPSQ